MTSEDIQELQNLIKEAKSSEIVIDGISLKEEMATVLFKKEPFDTLVKKIVELAIERRRNGIPSLEPYAKKEKNPFLKKYLSLLIDGVEPNDIKKLADMEMEMMFDRVQHIEFKEDILEIASRQMKMIRDGVMQIHSGCNPRSIEAFVALYAIGHGKVESLF